MKLITTTALALVAALATTPAMAQNNSAPAQQPAQPQIKPSAKALKAIVDLQTAVNNKDYANLPAKVAAANAVASTKEDRYVIATLRLKAAAAQNDTAGVASAMDAVTQTGMLNPAKESSLYVSLGGTYLNNKQYAQAAAAFQKATTLDPNNAQAPDLLGRALFLSGQKAEAASVYRKIIESSTAAGRKPPELTYKLAVQSALDSKSADAVNLGREWLAAYPSSESWHAALGIYHNANQLDVESTLDLLRLMQATGSLTDPADYALFAADDAEQNNFNEAQAVLDAGIAAHVVNPAAPNMREIVSAIKGRPKATAADLAIATKSAVNGMALLHIGDRYYAMGDYPKAVELYHMAQGKPGVDPAIANLHIGMALARQGDKAGATTAFNAVTGPRADIAKYWLIYVNQKA